MWSRGKWRSMPGVDHQAILRAAETEADVLVGDGGTCIRRLCGTRCPHVSRGSPLFLAMETLDDPGTATYGMAHTVLPEICGSEHIHHVKAADTTRTRAPEPITQPHRCASVTPR